MDYNARVVARHEVAPGLIILRVAPEGWALPPFEPGQFAVLGLPGVAPRVPEAEPEIPPLPPHQWIRRAYSIASSSKQHEYLEFYLALVRTGALTPRLFRLHVGDRLWLSPRFSGLFTLRHVPANAHLVLIATGTGLAPYMSMLRTHLGENNQRRTAVIHGARYPSDLGYRNELEDLARRYGHLLYLPVVSRPQGAIPPWSGLVGHVQDVWRSGFIAEAWGFAPEPHHTHVFLCGNPAMIDDMTRLLVGEGYREHHKDAPGQIHAERYW